MGASDAINALRSEAVAKTTLVNIVSDNVGSASSDAQKQAGSIKAARSNAQQKMESENNRTDRVRMDIRQSTKSAGEGLIKFIFQAASGSAGGALNAAAEIVKVVADISTIIQDMIIRDRHERNLMANAAYTSIYAPFAEAAR